jgi:hypothetical protein
MLDLRLTGGPSSAETGTGYERPQPATSRIPITAYGHQPDMGDEEPRSKAVNDLRRSLKRGLGPYRTYLRTILDHIDHMDQGDLDQLGALLGILEGNTPTGRGEILRHLRAVHTKEQCQLDMAREDLAEPETPAKMSLWETIRQGIRQDRKR